MTRSRLFGAAVFGGAALAFSRAFALVTTRASPMASVGLALRTLLSVGGFSATAAVLVGALAGPAMGVPSGFGGAVAGMAVTAVAFVPAVALVAVVAAGWAFVRFARRAGACSDA